ncbi:MAG: glycosyltransferase family 39 protein, partial [Planctomycetota bacterium]|nr:glycosyltransferase family 39 protein [Planctomycetota bacterium]
GLVLHTAFDSVSLPNYELTLTGNIAKIWLTGWSGAPLHQYYDNCGGHLATGLFAIPFFGAFGDSYLVLKLVPVALGAGTIVLMWLLLTRHFGRCAANLAVFLFVLGPPTLTKYSMLAKGNHFENLFFQLLSFWLFYRMHTAENKRPWLIAWAASAGFAIFFYFGSGALIALLGILHLLIRGPRQTLRDVLLSIAPFVVGLSPLLWVHFSSDARPGNFLYNKFGTGSQASRFFERTQNLVTDILPRSGVFEDLGPIRGTWAEWVLLALFLIVWCAALPSILRGVGRALAGWRRPKGSAEVERTGERERFEALRLFPLFAYLPFFILVYGASSFHFDAYGPPVEVGQFRYLVPHFTYSAMLLAIVAGGWIASQSALWRGAGRALAGTGLALGIFAIALVDWSFAETGLGTRYPGYDYSYYNNTILRDSMPDEVSGQLTWDFERVRAQLADFPLEDQHEIAFGIGHHCAWAQSLPGLGEKQVITPAHFDLVQLLAPFPRPELQPDIARGGGSFLRRLMKINGGRKKLRKHLQELASSGHPMAPYVIEGLSRSSEYSLARLTAKRLGTSQALSEVMPPEFAWVWRRGQGSQCGRLMARGIPADLALVEKLGAGMSVAAQPEFWFGVGIGWGQIGDSLPSDWRSLVPEGFRVLALQGFGRELRHRLDAAQSAPRFKELARQLEQAESAAFDGGLRWPGEYPVPAPL